MECMRTFCNDQQIDINTRLSILEALKKIIKSMSDQDLMLLLVYKTNAILAASTQAGTSEIDADAIDTELKRVQLMREWIESAQSDADYAALLNLFRIWPKFSQSIDDDDSPILVYLSKIAGRRTAILDVLGSVLEHDQDEAGLVLTTSDLDVLIARVREQHVDEWSRGAHDETLKRNVLKIALVFCDRDNLAFVRDRFLDALEFDCFRAMDESWSNGRGSDDMDPTVATSYQNLVEDNELADLLLKHHSYCALVNTKLYAVFLQNLVNNKQKRELLSVVGELKSRGLSMEAGEMLSIVENFFPAYRTLSVSLALVNKLS